MKKKLVIHASNLPGKLPTHATITAAMAIKIWHINGWFMVVVVTLLALLWLGCIVNLCSQRQVQIIDLIKQVNYPEQILEKYNSLLGRLNKTVFILCLISWLCFGCTKEKSVQCGTITAATPTTITVNGRVIPVTNGSFVDLMGRTIYFYKVGDKYCK